MQTCSNDVLSGRCQGASAPRGTISLALMLCLHTSWVVGVQPSMGMLLHCDSHPKHLCNHRLREGSCTAGSQDTASGTPPLPLPHPRIPAPAVQLLVDTASGTCANSRPQVPHQAFCLSLITPGRPRASYSRGGQEAGVGCISRTEVAWLSAASSRGRRSLSLIKQHRMRGFLPFLTSFGPLEGSCGPAADWW